jgi:hypothetical protein
MRDNCLLKEIFQSTFAIANLEGGFLGSEIIAHKTLRSESMFDHDNESLNMSKTEHPNHVPPL